MIFADRNCDPHSSHESKNLTAGALSKIFKETIGPHYVQRATHFDGLILNVVGVQYSS